MRQVFLTSILFSNLIFSAQDNNVLTTGEKSVWFIDGIKITDNITLDNKDKALKAFVKYINGKWQLDTLKQMCTFKFSPQFYTGYLAIKTANGIDTTNAKLDILKGWVCFIKYNKGQPIDTSLIKFEKTQFSIGRRLFLRNVTKQ